PGTLRADGGSDANSQPGGGACLLCPTGADALRKLRRGDLPAAAAVAASLSQRLRLLSLGRRPRRRDRRRAARRGTAALVAPGTATLLRGRGAASRHDRVATHHREVRHSPPTVPRPAVRLRAGSTRQALRNV